MATVTSVKPITATAGAAFTAADYCHLVRLDNTADGARAIRVGAVTDSIIGVYAMQGPASEGDEITIWPLHGIVKMEANEAITAGEVVTPHTNGKVNGQSNLAGIATGGMGVGVAMKTAAVGERFPVWAMPIAGSA